ncbi:MAG: MerC domain-containing protein [Myxococcaceae bacterium]|nr:MerC domain-containing protein [Myxococcaceae bacterium]
MSGHRSDLVGTALSGACMVHCVSMPGVMAAAPAAGAVLGGFHPLLLIAVAGVALWAFVPGWRRHREGSVLVGAAVGLTLLAAAAFAFDEGVLETVFSLAGAVAMMAAHLKNRALLRAA